MLDFHTFAGPWVISPDQLVIEINLTIARAMLNKNSSSEMISPNCEGLQLTSAKVSDDLGFSNMYLFCSLL